MIEGNHKNITFAAFEDATWGNHVMMPTAAARFDRAPAQAQRLRAQVMVMEVGIDQRHIDPLAFAAALTIQQRGKHRAQAVNPGTDIADAHRV